VVSIALLTATMAICAEGFDPFTVSAGLYQTDKDTAPMAVVITGEVTTMGLSGPFEIVLTSDGRYRWETDTRLHNLLGYDGEKAWERDWNNTPREMQYEQYDRTVVESLLWSGAWSRGHTNEGRMVLGTEEQDTSGQWLIPYTFGERGMHGTITVDQANAEVVAFSSGSKVLMQEFTLEEFQNFGDVRWPAKITLKVPDSLDTIFETHKIAVIDEPQEAQDLLQPDLAAPTDFRFQNDISADLEIRRAPTGHLLVHPLLDGQDAGWFIFDTGAGAIVLDNSVGIELGYEGFGEVVAEGVGGRVPSNFYRGSALQLGRLEMDDPIYLGLDLAFLNGIMGVRIAGIIGYGVLSRAVVEFDSATPRISIFEASSYQLADGQWGEMMLADRLPNVHGRFEGHDGVFKLDTGASGTITFHQPTTERLHMLKNRRLEDTQMGGVGGSVQGKQGLLQNFELGGHKMDHIEVQFATEAKGVFANAYTDGNIGTELLEPFILVFDYQQTRIAFVKR
jgi:hypothetical protein